LPDLPPVADFVPGYEASTWYGLGAPRNTPAEIVDKLNKEINAALSDRKIKARLADLGGNRAERIARRFRKAHRRRNREMGQGSPGSQHQAGVTLALADVPYVPFGKSDRAHVAFGSQAERLMASPSCLQRIRKRT